MAGHIQFQTYVNKLQSKKNRLCKLGVLEFQPTSEWASLSFITPKTDQIVCVINDFWEVNKKLVRKPFPIPKISTVLQELEGFTFATALDLNMGYYTIRLDPDASIFCTIVSLGEVFLPQVTNGDCRFTRHFSSKDVRANGSP